MSLRPTKVLIVDDSALMRKHLVSLFRDQGFETEIARNGAEALEVNLRFEPDVITLDINMPEMDGLTCLSRLMSDRPCPVVMLSSLTEKGALATLEAMALGAVDYLAKPSGTISLNIDVIHRTLVDKVRVAAKAKVRVSKGLSRRLREQNEVASRSAPALPAAPAPARRAFIEPRVLPRPTAGVASVSLSGLVLIGVSTGGPRTLEEILPLLPADFPWPVVVAQHMPHGFTGALARRMDGICKLNVVEAERMCDLEPGTVYIARGDADVSVVRRGERLGLMPRPASPQYLWHPSVEGLVRSALECIPAERLICVQLTGMGDDGADAMVEVKQRRGRVIAEDESTAVVFGMPAAVIERGGATVAMPCHRIAQQLIGWSV